MPRTNLPPSLRVLLVAAVVILFTGAALAGSTLHIGTGAGTGACDIGCGGDPTPVGTMQLSIYQNSGGADFPDDPLLLILGVPNVSGAGAFSSSSISGVNFYNPYPGSSVAGTALYSSSFTQGSQMNSSDVYTFLGLTGNNSNSFTNWVDADNDIGVSATFFGIYVFELTSSSADSTIADKGLADVTFASDLPIGTYAVGWGQIVDNSGPHTKITVFDTPFTEAGQVGGTPPPPPPAVPEPASLALIGGGLAMVGRKFRKRRS